MVGVPRVNTTQQVHFLRRGLTFANEGQLLVVGTIPAGATILKSGSGAQVVALFAGADTSTASALDIGMVDSAGSDVDHYGSALDLSTAVVFLPLDEAIGGFRVTNDTDITAKITTAGAAATSGQLEAVILYVPDTDG